MSNIKIQETPLGQLHCVTPRGEFDIEPLPASKGAPLAAMVMGVSFGGKGLTEKEQEDMYRLAVGDQNFQWAMDNLRLPEAQDVMNLSMFWQTTGIDAAQAFLDGGVEKALEVQLERMGLSLSTILLHLGLDEKTQSPDGTSGTSTQKTSENKSSDETADPESATSSGKTS